jgi:hypothetical protein
MNVRFCPNCRSLILVDFRFCPYCGVAAAKGPEIADALAEPFDRMGGPPPGADAPAKASAKTNVFASAEESLVRLESDMDLLIEALEKESRSSSG